MLKRRNNIVLGLYDLVLAAGAIITGIQMVMANSGIFSEYPQEWLSKLPFHSWVSPGIIAILLFGTGNILSAFLSLKNSFTLSWLSSAVTGLLLLVCIIAQVIILGEWYLASIELFIAAMIQIILSGYVLSTRRIRK
ncbi:MAG TPA: hypothetical protein VHP38_10920 [Ruminiclostridium sp.]|nr:hypothetical protein [Ruminiclostridium sp.]